MLFRKLYEAVSTHSKAKLPQNKNASTVIFKKTVTQSEAWITQTEEALAYFIVYDQRGLCARQTDSSLTIREKPALKCI